MNSQYDSYPNIEDTLNRTFINETFQAPLSLRKKSKKETITKSNPQINIQNKEVPKNYYNNNNIPINNMNVRYNSEGNNINNSRNVRYNYKGNNMDNNRNIGYNSMKDNRKNSNHHYSNIKDDIGLQFLPKQNTLTTISNESISNSNDYRLEMISDELLDKDEEIQQYKNEIYKLHIEMNKVKEKKDNSISYEMENKALKVKLNEMNNNSRELTDLKHKYIKGGIDNKNNIRKINELKIIIHKQYLELMNHKKNNSYKISDEEIRTELENTLPKNKINIKSSYKIDDFNINSNKGGIKTQITEKLSSSSEEDYSSEEDILSEDESSEEEKASKKNIQLKPKYYNTILKKNFINKYSEKKIDKVMNEMKITPKTKITEKVLMNFLNKLKK